MKQSDTVLTGTVLGYRGQQIETRHQLDAVVVDRTGRLIWSFGDATAATFMRSVAKPFQAAAVYESLSATTRQHLKTEELAIIAASHGGGAAHQQWVLSVLAKAGLPLETLVCGGHWPKERTEYRRLIQENTSPTILHHNCSGKHAGMVLACVENQWPVETYYEREHPLQQAILLGLNQALAEPVKDIAIDGCGVPVHYLSLQQIAHLFAQLIDHDRFRPVALAMQQFPELIGDSARIDTVIMKASQGRLLAKVGADGVLAVCDTQQHQGFALKCWDGMETARDTLTLACLKQCGFLDGACYEAIIDAHPQWSLVRKNGLGAAIGQYTVLF